MLQRKNSHKIDETYFCTKYFLNKTQLEARFGSEKRFQACSFAWKLTNLTYFTLHFVQIISLFLIHCIFVPVIFINSLDGWHKVGNNDKPKKQVN